ncbi:MAG: TonB-dependent receptor [Capnocytophaga sp.]|nr:TonB-dependent receptor [Capnocytophaga sp.]
MQQHTLSGTVTDAQGMPLPGVSVVVKGTTRGVATDFNGRYEIAVSASEILEFSYLGYKTVEVTVGTSATLNVTLQEDSQQLDEVVVVGFGTQRKVNLTGSVATVNTELLDSRPVSQLGQALQGAVPGLNLNVGSLGGQLGQTMNINVRGAGTIGQGSGASPLILIDGIEGNMQNLNPNDIASISVLKDAASSAIYGSRAAFGVILITTKRGLEGKMTLTYSSNLRYSGPANLPNQLDSWRFANYFNEAAANQGQGAIFDDDTLNRIQQYMAGEITTTTIPNGRNWNFHQRANDNVNWWKTHFGWSWASEHNVSLRGGSERLKYYASANLLDQDGNLTYGKDTYKRVNAMLRIDTKINDYLEFNVDTKFIRFTLDNPLLVELPGNSGLFYHNIVQMWPMMPFKDPNGYYMRNGRLASMTSDSRAVTNNDNLYAQGQFILRPLKNWNIYAQAGTRIVNQNKHSQLVPVFEYDIDGNPLPMLYALGVSAFPAGATFAEDEYANTNFYTTSLYSDYSFGIDRHDFKIMLGMNTEESKSKGLGARRPDLITPLVPQISAATGEDKIQSSYLQNWATAGVFGRLNYSFADKYMIEANLRYDGSSRFLRNQRWTWLPSFSVGWNVANEAFFEPLAQYVNTLKPRFSWGTLGNQNTSSLYPFYLTQGVSANGGSWLVGGSRPTIAYAPGVISDFLTWEKVYNTNYGVDVGAFNSRLQLSFDYFVRTTEDMVGPAAEVGAAYGIGLPPTNNAKLRNKGWELQIDWNDQIGDFKYSLGFNLSDNRVRVLSYPNPSNSLGTYYNGQELGEIWGYTTQGIAKTDQEMTDWLAHTSQQRLSGVWQAGDIMYVDTNGDGEISSGANTLDDPGDRSIIGNSNPRFRFGFNLGAAYKGFDLGIFLQGVMKRDYWLGGSYFWGTSSGGMWQATGFEEHLDYFRPEGTTSVFGANVDAYYPRPYMGGRAAKNEQVQTRYLQNAAYLRVKNIQLGYSLPQEVLAKVGIDKLRVYVSGENLMTFSKVAKMYDPEVLDGGFGSGKSYPLSQTISFGVNLSL